MSMKRLAQKKKCIQHRALIVAWLRVNYCLRESGSIAKRDVFVHYIELCQANKIQPSSAASFGKILKMAFPTVRCNRVGPRGASKHHYRGLVLRDSYHLSLAGVQPISEAAINEMMRHLEEEEGRAASNKAAGKRSRESDDEDEESDERDDDSDEGHASRLPVPSHYGPGIKREVHHLQPYPAATQQLHHSASPNELQPLSSSSVPSSPGTHRRGGGHGHYGASSPPSTNGYATAAASSGLPTSLYPPTGYAAAPQLHQQQQQQQQQPQHAEEYRAPAFVLPPPGYSYSPYNVLQQQQQQLQQQQMASTARFSWVSPEMDSARGVFPVLPLPPQQQQQGHADKEWMEKRELVSFCERTFESLYDTILRTSCGPSKDQVLTYIVDAWKNLQDYTRQHMSLLPPSAAAAAVGSPQVAMQAQQHQLQPVQQLPPRYHELDDELKRKAVLDSFHNNNAPSLAQFHQPLVEHMQQQMQQDGMRSTSPVSPPSSSSTSAATSAAAMASSSSSASSSSMAASTEENHSSTTNNNNNGNLGLLMPPPSGFSFTGSSSALSLSWLNSMVASSMQNAAAAPGQRPPALPSPTLVHSPNNLTSGPGGAHTLPFADLVGKRGSLEGLEYRSFEWKGAF